jgi:hypothetical protein
MRDRLKGLQSRMEEAQKDLHDALVVAYPVDKEVLVMLSAAQKKPTRGTVMSHGSDRFAGRVTLRLHCLRKGARDFPWEELR